jgi:hypothetical protein
MGASSECPASSGCPNPELPGIDVIVTCIPAPIAKVLLHRCEPASVAMADDAHREFYGLVEGERLAFRVTASVDNDVEDMKKLVQLEKKRGPLRDIDAAALILWKVTTL